MDTQHAGGQTAQNRHQKTLMTVSVILWFISLFMVVVYTDKDTIYYGLDILAFIPAAWMWVPAGFADYANLFYWWIICSLIWGRKKKPVIAATIMILLSLLTFTLRSVLADEGINRTDDVIAWGYGAFVWGFALILMAGVVWDKRQFYSVKQTLLPYFIPFFVIMSGLFGLKYYQWTHANIYEREEYLPDRVAFSAFSTFKPSNIHYEVQPFPKNLPNTEIPLEVNGKVVLHYHYPNTPVLDIGNNSHYSLPNQIFYNGYIIKTHDNFNSVEKSTVQPVYRYQIQTINNKLRLSLYDIKQQREIWYGEADDKHYDNLFYKAIKPLFNIQPDTSQPDMTLPQQVNFTDECPADPVPEGIRLDNDALLQIDNKVIHQIKNIQKVFCQNNLVLSINRLYTENIYATIRQRNNLNILSEYKLSKPTLSNELPEKYRENFPENIQSATLNNNGLLIKGEFGEILLEKYHL